MHQVFKKTSSASGFKDTITKKNSHNEIKIYNLYL